VAPGALAPAAPGRVRRGRARAHEPPPARLTAPRRPPPAPGGGGRAGEACAGSAAPAARRGLAGRGTEDDAGGRRGRRTAARRGTAMGHGRHAGAPLGSGWDVPRPDGRRRARMGARRLGTGDADGTRDGRGRPGCVRGVRLSGVHERGER
jgi:hypothetical protein